MIDTSFLTNPIFWQLMIGPIGAVLLGLFVTWIAIRDSNRQQSSVSEEATIQAELRKIARLLETVSELQGRVIERQERIKREIAHRGSIIPPKHV